MGENAADEPRERFGWRRIFHIFPRVRVRNRISPDLCPNRPHGPRLAPRVTASGRSRASPSARATDGQHGPTGRQRTVEARGENPGNTGVGRVVKPRKLIARTVEFGTRTFGPRFDRGGGGEEIKIKTRWP